MTRLAASVRFDYLSRALAIAEDREGAALAEIAAELGCTHDDLCTVLAPVFVVEPVERGEPLGFELAHAVSFEPYPDEEAPPSPETQLVVETNWWRELARPSPAESVTIYLLAATVIAMGGGSDSLATAARKLAGRLRADVEVHEDNQPPMAAKLERFSDRRELAHCRIEGEFETLGPLEGPIEVHAVYRSGDQWLALYRAPHGLESPRFRGQEHPGESDPSNREDLESIPIDRVLSADPTGETFERDDIDELPAGLVVTHEPLRVVLEIDQECLSVLDDFRIERSDPLSNGRVRVTVEVWGETELKTVLLRLADRGQVVEPPELTDLGERVAREILDLYDT